MMNRFFNGASTSTRLSCLAPSQNGLFHWGQVCLRQGGFGKISSAVPNGYGVGSGLFPPIKEGGMSAYTYNAISADAAAALTNGGMMTGSMTVEMTSDAMLSIIMFFAGSSSFEFTADGPILRLTMGLGGSGTIAFDFDNNTMSIIDPLSGSFDFSVLSEADLRGLLSMAGAFTPYTELSPENLAAAVWNADADTYDTPGTMGARVGTGGAPTPEENAAAVLAAAEDTPIHSDTKKIRGQELTGSGTESDPWGPA